MRWSPDGRRIRLRLEEVQGDKRFPRLWEASLTKATAAKVLPGWSRTASDEEYGGEWSPDGRFFVFTAIHEGKPDHALLSYEYLQMLPQLAEGDANKVFVVPSEFASAFAGIGEALKGKPAAPPASPAPRDLPA